MLHVCLFGCCVWLQWFSSVFQVFFQVFHKHFSTDFVLQPLYLDVVEVDRVLHLSSSHLMLHRLSRSRQGIHMNEGWAMSVGRGSCMRRAQARELHTDEHSLWSGMCAGRRGLRTSQFGSKGGGTWWCGRGGRALSCCAGATYVRGAWWVIVQKPRLNAGVGSDVRTLGLPLQ
jgi:hypothetical protein